MLHAPRHASGKEKGVAVLVAIFGVALFSYLATSSRAVLGGDNGEFVMLFARGGGVAHPPGYPLFTAYLRLLAWMPGASPAEASARATALVGAAAVVAIHFAARSWNASYLASCVAAAAWALLPLAWKMSVHAEVFAMHALLAALVLGVCGPHAPVRGGKRIAALGLLAGLGLSNHHTIIFLFPVGVVALVRAFKDERARVGGAVAGLGALAVGLTPYALLWRASHAADGRWVWRGPMSPSDVWRHFLRADYWTQRESALSTVANEPGLHLPSTEHVMEQLRFLLEGVPSIVLVLAIIGAARLVFRRPWRDAIEGCAFVLTFVLAGPWSNALHILKPFGIGHIIVERFYLLGQLVLCVALALAIDPLLARLRRRAAAAALLSAAFLARGLVFVRADVDEYTRPTVELYLRNTLRSLPRDAVLLGSGDHRFYGFLVEQGAYGMRPDVTYVDMVFLAAPWYRARIRAERGLELPAPSAAPVAKNVLEAALASGRPVFVADHLDRLPPGFPHYPHGTVERVLEPRELEPDPFTLVETNAQLLEAMEREARPPLDKWSWAGDLASTYDQPWYALARRFDALGMKDESRSCMARIR